MPQPTAYSPSTNFAADELANAGGRSTVRTAAVDGEFAAIATTLTGVRTNLALNQRDDGEIRDERVKLHTLSADVKALLGAGQGLPRGAWLTATAYALRDIVVEGGNSYICASAHTSGTFATDLAASNWLLLAFGSAVAASSIPFTATATIAATDVQAAIEEADTENRALSAAAAASAVSLTAAVVADLADTTDPANGAAMIGIKAAGTGAVARTVLAMLLGAATMVTVDDYGADPTGVADSTQAFADMLTATGRIVMKPFGTYLVDATGYPTKRAVIHKTGGAFYMLGLFSTLKYKDTAAGPIGLNFVELTNVEGGLIQGVIFDGNRANQSYGYHSIAIMGGKRITVRDCVCKNNYYDGIYIRASTVGTLSTYPADILLDNVICEANGRNGVSIIGANVITVRGGRFSTSVGDPGAGIDVEPNVSDIHGVRGLKIIGAAFTGNAARGLMITGNVPATPGETPYCLDADVADITCNGNSAAQDAVRGGCDVFVYYCRSFTLRGYKNVSGETLDPVDAGLVYIHNTVVTATVNGVEIKGIANPTNTKGGVYIDSGNEPHRWVSNVRVSDSNLVGVSGGKYSVIDNVVLEDVTGNQSIVSGTTDSGFTNITAIRSSVIQAYNTSGTGAYSIRGITVIDPTARGLRLYQQGSTVRDIIIRHSGTPATQAVWIESITDCNLSGFTISDAGGYWDTPSNAYLISQSSLSGNRLRDMVPSPLSGTATWDPASIADGAAASTTVSLLRADVGDACRVSNSVSLAGLTQFASVTASNTATVTLFNKTGGAVDLASHTVSVEALK